MSTKGLMTSRFKSPQRSEGAAILTACHKTKNSGSIEWCQHRLVLLLELIPNPEEMRLCMWHRVFIPWGSIFFLHTYLLPTTYVSSQVSVWFKKLCIAVGHGMDNKFSQFFNKYGFVELIHRSYSESTFLQGRRISSLGKVIIEFSVIYHVCAKNNLNLLEKFTVFFRIIFNL